MLTVIILIFVTLLYPEVIQTKHIKDKCFDRVRCDRYVNPCREPFLRWAHKNCRKYCKFCSEEEVEHPVTVSTRKSSGQRLNENVIPIDNAKRKPAMGDGSGQCRSGKRRFANGERTTDENRCQLICEDGQLINDNFGCKFRGHCYRPDETWVDGCSEYKCEINYEPKTVKYEAVVSKHNEGCQVAGTDKCYRDGEEWKTDCKVFKCVVSVNVQENNTHGQRVVRNDIVIVEKECKDYDGNCHKPGQNFTYNCFGKRCHDCSCELVNDRVMYSCPIQVT